jgi:predicted dehydrogenase
VEIVDICLPTYLHKDAVLKCAKAGKDVLCEKPMTLSLKEADEMIKAAKKTKVKFMVAHVIRFWPEYVVFKEIMENKSLGKLIYANFMRHSPTPTWTWQSWGLDVKKSLSAAVDLHIHDIDYILYLSGMPEKVTSIGTSKVTKGIDHIMTEYSFAKGPKCYSEGGWAFPQNYPFRMAFWALFEKGALEFNSMNLPLTIYEEGKEAVKPKLPEGDGYLREIQYFLKCVEEGKYPETVTPEDARDSLKVALCELESVKKGKAVAIK